MEYHPLVLLIGTLAFLAERAFATPRRMEHDEHNPGCTLLLLIVGVVAALIVVGVWL